MSQKIINAPYPNDCNIAVGEMSITYRQEPDTNDTTRDKYDMQELVIKTEECAEKGEGNGGYFFSIKTDRWAFDDINELIAILEDFKKRIGL